MAKGRGAMTEYTEAEHAKRLIYLFEHWPEDVCGKCPVSRGCHMPYDKEKCAVCTTFVGLSKKRPQEVISKWNVNSECPCTRVDDPGKTTWLALEAKGYLE